MSHLGFNEDQFQGRASSGTIELSFEEFQKLWRHLPQKARANFIDYLETIEARKADQKSRPEIEPLPSNEAASKAREGIAEILVWGEALSQLDQKGKSLRPFLKAKSSRKRWSF